MRAASCIVPYTLCSKTIVQEAENLRTRYNDGILEKQRQDQEVASLRRYG